MSSSSTDFVSIHRGAGYSSDLRRPNLMGAAGSSSGRARVPLDGPSSLTQAKGEEGRRGFAKFICGLDAYSRHQRFLNDYVHYYGGGTQGYLEKVQAQVEIKTDYDVLQAEHRFIWNDDDSDETVQSYEKRIAKAYYDKLYREYCIADLSRHREGKVGLRWRTESEVIQGKGQFSCGNKACDQREHLRSYEVNFKYKEADAVKTALVKVRVCSVCAHMLFYKSKKKMKEARRQAKRKMKKQEERMEKERKKMARVREKKEEKRRRKEDRKRKREGRGDDDDVGEGDVGIEREETDKGREETGTGKRRRKDVASGCEPPSAAHEDRHADSRRSRWDVRDGDGGGSGGGDDMTSFDLFAGMFK